MLDEKKTDELDTEKLDQGESSSEALGAEKSGQETVNLDPAALAEELKRLRSTNERLLSENQQHKNRRKKAEEDKLLAEGKKDELIEQYKNEITELRTEKQTFHIAEAVAEEAKKRGCNRWDHLYRLTGGDGIKYDNDSGQVVGVEDFFNRYENDPEYDFYFQKVPAVKTENRTPSVDSGIVDYSDEAAVLARLKKLRETDRGKYNQEVIMLKQKGILR